MCLPRTSASSLRCPETSCASACGEVSVGLSDDVRARDSVYLLQLSRALGSPMYRPCFPHWHAHELASAVQPPAPCKQPHPMQDLCIGMRTHPSCIMPNHTHLCVWARLCMTCTCWRVISNNVLQASFPAARRSIPLPAIAARHCLCNCMCGVHMA